MEAGLPNITGKLAVRPTSETPNPTGAFYINGISEYLGKYNGGTNYSNGVSFNASRSSSIYGNSSTVTPLSMSCKFYISY